MTNDTSHQWDLEHFVDLLIHGYNFKDFAFANFNMSTISLMGTRTPKDDVVLKERSFREFMEKKWFVIVEFYVPWCGHS